MHENFKVTAYQTDPDDKDDFVAYIGTASDYDAIRIDRSGNVTQPAKHVRPSVTWYSSDSRGDLDYAYHFSRALSMVVRAARMIDAGADPKIALKGVGFEFVNN